MGGRLRSTVYLTGEDGTTKCLPAGSVPTAAEAALIVNAKAWEDGHPPPAVEPEKERSGLRLDDPGVIAALERARAETWATLNDTLPTRPPAPPRSGPGSRKKAWSDYAAALGVTIPDDADRDSIIAAVDAHPGA